MYKGNLYRLGIIFILGFFFLSCKPELSFSPQTHKQILPKAPPSVVWADVNQANQLWVAKKALSLPLAFTIELLPGSKARLYCFEKSQDQSLIQDNKGQNLAFKQYIDFPSIQIKSKYQILLTSADHSQFLQIGLSYDGSGNYIPNQYEIQMHTDVYTGKGTYLSQTISGLFSNKLIQGRLSAADENLAQLLVAPSKVNEMFAHSALNQLDNTTAFQQMNFSVFSADTHQDISDQIMQTPRTNKTGHWTAINQMDIFYNQFNHPLKVDLWCDKAWCMELGQVKTIYYSLSNKKDSGPRVYYQLSIPQVKLSFQKGTKNPQVLFSFINNIFFPAQIHYNFDTHQATYSISMEDLVQFLTEQINWKMWISFHPVILKYPKTIKNIYLQFHYKK